MGEVLGLDMASLIIFVIVTIANIVIQNEVEFIKNYKIEKK